MGAGGATGGGMMGNTGTGAGTDGGGVSLTISPGSGSCDGVGLSLVMVAVLGLYSGEWRAESHALIIGFDDQFAGGVVDHGVPLAAALFHEGVGFGRAPGAGG